MAAKRGLVGASKLVWRLPLDRESTVSMLAGREVRVADDGILHFADRRPVSGGRLPNPFAQRNSALEPEYIWLLKRDAGIRSIGIASSGTILLNRKYLLDTDFGSVAGVADVPFSRRRLDIDVVVAPWSHKWATYYEFVIHILGKLCRIKQTIDPSLWAEAKVCYPLRGAPYEQQYLALLGIDESALVDTRQHAIVPGSVVISNLQSRDRLATPTRLASLRDTYLAGARPPEDRGRRLYLSRVGWKRQVINESEVRDVVSSYGLEVIESIPVSVEDQIRLFNSASLVVSPHGSALANLVWCSPGTRVIELFSRSFVSDVYAGICHVLGLRHTYLLDESEEPPHWTNLHKDLTVDIRSLITALEQAMV